MKRKERIRDTHPALSDPAYWDSRTAEGWRLVAAEWERETDSAGESGAWVEEVPFGLMVDEDCLHLVENPAEKEAMSIMLEMIVADKPLSEVAERVNAGGFRTRKGKPWTQVDIFQLLPRLVAVTSRIYPTYDWSERRKRIYGSAG